MGNFFLKSLRGCCEQPETPHEPQSLGPHGLTPATAGLSALAHDLFTFELTSQVPERLAQHVISSKTAHATWYRKLLEAWKEAKPPPRTPEEAADLVAQALKRHQTSEVEGILAYYGLPPPHHTPVGRSGISSRWPQGVQFELHTLPVDPKAVGDGDSFTVYVDTADPRESASVPLEVHEAVIEWRRVRAAKNYTKADAIKRNIVEAGYRIINGPTNEEMLARKYRIRLRGIDAPEGSMPYGEEAKDELLRLIQRKRLTIHVYNYDQYGRCVGDVYCNGTFVQEQMLKGGFAWHYKTYDQRKEFEMWEKEARIAHRGLWASSNPEKPWEWRRGRRSGRWRGEREENVVAQVY